jgi:hypothetical protein
MRNMKKKLEQRLSCPGTTRGRSIDSMNDEMARRRMQRREICGIRSYPKPKIHAQVTIVGQKVVSSGRLRSSSKTCRCIRLSHRTNFS